MHDQLSNTRAIIDAILKGELDDASHWHERAHNLAELFVKNFEKFTDTQAGKDLLKSGPQLPN